MPGVPLGPIIWPLVTKLRPHLAAQQRPRSTGGLPIPGKPVNKPWNAASYRHRLNDALTLYPSVVHQLLPPPAYDFSISGVTKDSTGAILGSCTVKLYFTGTDVLAGSTTSDATTGAYVFRSLSRQLTYFIVAYKVGSPDVAGTTVNTVNGT